MEINSSWTKTFLQPRIIKRPEIERLDGKASDSIISFKKDLPHYQNFTDFFIKNRVFNKTRISYLLSELEKNRDKFSSFLSSRNNFLNFSETGYKISSNNYTQLNFAINALPQKDIYQFSLSDDIYGSSNGFEIDNNSVSFEEINSPSDFIKTIENIDPNYSISCDNDIFTLSSYSPIVFSDNTNTLFENLSKKMNATPGILYFNNNYYFSEKNLFKIDDTTSIETTEKSKTGEFSAIPSLNKENVKKFLKDYTEKFNITISSINTLLKEDYTYFSNNAIEILKLDNESNIESLLPLTGLHLIKNRSSKNEFLLHININTPKYSGIKIENNYHRNIKKIFNDIGIFNNKDGTLTFDETLFEKNIEKYGEKELYDALNNLKEKSMEFSDAITEYIKGRKYILSKLSLSEFNEYTKKGATTLYSTDNYIPKLLNIYA